MSRTGGNRGRSCPPAVPARDLNIACIASIDACISSWIFDAWGRGARCEPVAMPTVLHFSQ